MKASIASLSLSLAAAALAGCAGPEVADAGKEVRAPRVYRTGSNIPVKDAPEPATELEHRRLIDRMNSMSRGGRPVGGTP
jgi:hypothetical protein